MKIINNTKFFSFNEIIVFLNAKKADDKTHYRIPELAVAWADTRAQYYQSTGKQVQDGVHFILAADSEQFLSLEACKLIEKLATVDGHNMPIITDGATELYN